MISNRIMIKTHGFISVDYSFLITIYIKMLKRSHDRVPPCLKPSFVSKGSKISLPTFTDDFVLVGVILSLAGIPS